MIIQNEKKAPSHLVSTIQLISRAYPSGVPFTDYMPLLSVLSEYLCEENVSLVAELIIGSRLSHHNDVLESRSKEQDTSSVLEKLKKSGMDDWINE